MNSTTKNYHDFFSGLSDCLIRELGSGYETKAVTNTQNNGVQKNGILIRHISESSAPAIYLDEFYEEFRTGKCLSDIVRQVLYTYHDTASTCKKQSFEDIDFSPQAMKDKIVIRIVNYSRNAEFLSSVPHIRLFDLAVIFHLMVYQDNDGIGTVKFTNEHFQTFRSTRKGQIPIFQDLFELYALALKNTQRLFPVKLSSLDDVLKGLLTHESAPALPFYTAPQMPPSFDRQLFVLTNEHGINGSACILYPDILSRLTQFFHSEFFILPSSIHELLLLPTSTPFCTEELNDMIREINLTQVPKEEILSDRAYRSSEFCQLLKLKCL